LKKYFADYVLLFSIAGAIVLLDQLTKIWVRTNLQFTEMYRPDLWISEYARIIFWKNTGAAFGMFGSLGNVFLILSFVVSIAIVYYFPQIPRKDWVMRLAMCLLLGGAVGNLISRLYQGYVTDFISILNLPVFNVADFSITTGVIVLFAGMLYQEWQLKNSKPVTDTPPAEDLGVDPCPDPLPEETKGE
jgi:signal peptidase II